MTVPGWPQCGWNCEDGTVDLDAASWYCLQRQLLQLLFLEKARGLHCCTKLLGIDVGLIGHQLHHGLIHSSRFDLEQHLWHLKSVFP